MKIAIAAVMLALIVLLSACGKTVQEKPATTDRAAGFNCTVNRICEPDENEYSCPDDCACIDSDGGFNIHSLGNTSTDVPGGIDKCHNCAYNCNLLIYPAGCPELCATLEEFYCENRMSKSQMVQCEFGCSDGRCLLESERCNETDAGMDFLVKGSVREFNSDGAIEDKCLDKTVLMEYWCLQGRAYNGTYPCRDGCKDGACVIINPQPNSG